MASVTQLGQWESSAPEEEEDQFLRCIDCGIQGADQDTPAGGTLLSQSQLSQDHPGQLLQPKEGGAWWFISRHDNHQPTSWTAESAGAMMHEDQVVEVYWIDHQDHEAREADHVNTCDETIVPENLRAADKKDLSRALTATVDHAKERPMSSWLTILMASMAYSLAAGPSPMHMGGAR